MTSAALSEAIHSRLGKGRGRWGPESTPTQIHALLFVCILQGRVASYLGLAVSSPSMNTKPLRFHTLGDLSPRDEESIDQEGSAIKHFTQLPRWCKGTSRITNPRYPTFHFISKESEPLQILHSFLCTHGPHHTQVQWEYTFSPP